MAPSVVCSSFSRQGSARHDGGVNPTPPLPDVQVPWHDGLCRRCRANDQDDSNFATALARLMSSYKVTDYEIERITGIGHEYISRLRRGLKRSPSKDTVASMVFALARHGLQIADADRLYEAAGFVSPHRRKYRDDPVEDAST